MAGIGLCSECIERVFLDENFSRIEGKLYCESCAKNEHFKLSKLGELLHFFAENKVPIQLTLDPDVNPTVHALFKYNGDTIQATEEEILEYALLAMKNKYLDATAKWSL